MKKILKAQKCEAGASTFMVPLCEWMCQRNHNENCDFE